MRQILLLLALIFLLVFCTAEKKQTIKADYTQYVNPFIGTIDGGQVSPAACVPFGMVRLVCDNGEMISNYGYQADGTKINGFGHVHVSGTGGQPKYGNVLVMPLLGKVDPSSHSAEPFNYVSRPGYFNVFLAHFGINVELTATQSVGIHRYTFTKDGDGKILFDMGMCQGMNADKSSPFTQQVLSSSVKVTSNTEIEGFTEVRGGWNMGDPYKVFFYAITDTPSDSFALWSDNKILPGGQKEVLGKATGGYFCYNVTKSQRIHMKVGISFISTQKAKENIAKEIADKDFEKVMLSTKSDWQGILSKIEVSGGTEAWKEVFYSSLYRCFTMPTNRTGENPKWQSNEPYYDDFYAIWDSYRSQNPLFTIIAPSKEAEIIRSLVDMYKNEGYMPDARSGNCTGLTQGGSNADILIGEAYVKGLKGIDYEQAYTAMIKNAEVEPEMGIKWGRDKLEFYKNKGYVAATCTSSCSKTLEYAYNDYCIAQVAKGLGKTDDYNKYMKRSENWVNVWNPNISDHGAKGFIWPKNEDGSWVDTLYEKPTIFTKENLKTKFTSFTSGCWSGSFYESNSWEYSFYAPQNMKKLIELTGGAASFESRLDTFFTNGYYNVWNEPGFMTPCLYNYVNKQYKTSEIVTKTRRKYYNNSINGIPGNDDSGTMAAWFVFHALGFFPVSGQDVYLISTPLFSEAKINLEGGKSFTIKANNLSENNIYIQSLSLNGKKINRAWLRHNEIVSGGDLVFEMSDKPANWDTDTSFPVL